MSDSLLHARLFLRTACLAVALASCGIASCQRAGDPSATLDTVLGSQGLTPGKFIKPRAIAIDANDQIHVVDMQALIQVLDMNGKPVRHWLTPTHELGRPSGLAIDQLGGLLVADSHYHRVLRYDKTGALVEILGGDTGDQPNAGLFGYIGDILEDRHGNLYVAESQQNERITKLDRTGKILAQWGGRGSAPGQFQKIRSLIFDTQGLLVVADACNHRLQVFDVDGRFISAFGEAGENLGQLSYPYDVAVLSNGTLVVCEFGNHRVQFFAPSGKSLGTWGKPGRAPGELNHPWAVGVDRADRIYVVDSNNHRIQRILWKGKP